MRRVVVTGSGGLLGWHLAARMHAANCAARRDGEPEPYRPALLDRAGFNDDAALEGALRGADLVVHLAGINRGADAALEEGNIALASRLAAALERAGAAPRLVHANTLHAARDTSYGRGKRIAGETLAAWAARAGAGFADLVLPHIFGEGGKPFHNNVTGTFCHCAVNRETPEIGDGEVELLHAGAVANAALGDLSGTQRLRGIPISVRNLWLKIGSFNAHYRDGTYPDLSDRFNLELFNTLRTHLYPDGFPRPMTLNTDARGTLYEAARGGGGGQIFLSWTEPGATRGDHFHLSRVERFLVVEGEALIRIRRVLSDEVWEYRVTGEAPAAVDMPTLHTHSIQNTGRKPLLTLFWTNAIFDPSRPDTYADPVLERVTA